MDTVILYIHTLYLVSD